MEQIWWERVPNARSFVEDIVNSLLEEKSLILQHSDPLPWQSLFTACVKSSVRQQNSSKTFETLSGVTEPGSYLLQTFCKPEKKARYRPSKSYAGFLAESDDIVLHERYFWVELASAEQLEVWASFVSEYARGRRGKEPAVFVLEWQGREPTSRKKGVSLYSFESYVGEYDRIVFSMLASSAVSGSTLMKNYLAELAANVLGSDIELYAACFKQAQQFMREPYSVVLDCLSSACRSDGSAFQYTASRDSVEHAIWLAQIRTVYPALEEQRNAFVQRHRAEIKAQLPLASPLGETYNDPNDVELGPLVYLAASGRLSVSPAEYDRLVLLKDARNKLSHIKFLSFEELTQLRL